MTVRDKTGLRTQVSNNLPDNIDRRITPVRHREVLDDLIDSMALETQLSGAGLTINQVFNEIQRRVERTYFVGNRDLIPRSKLPPHIPASPYSDISLYPAGIPDMVYPNYLVFKLENLDQFSGKVPSGVTCELHGVTLPRDRSTPVTNIGTDTSLVLRFNISPAVRAVLQSNTLARDRNAPGTLIFSFTDGTNRRYRFAFGVNDPVFAEEELVIADGSIGTAQLADGAVSSRKMQTGSVTSGILADGAATGTKIPRDTIDQDHLTADSVGNSELRAGSVDTDELVNGSVTEMKLDSGVQTKLNATYEPPPYESVTMAPGGVVGEDLPDDLFVILSGKQHSRTITGATLNISGIGLTVHADTPVSLLNRVGADGASGTLKFSVSTADKNSFRTNVNTAHDSVPAQLTLTFSSGDPHVHTVAFLVNASPFATGFPVRYATEALAMAASSAGDHIIRWWPET